MIMIISFKKNKKRKKKRKKPEVSVGLFWDVFRLSSSNFWIEA